MPPVRTAALQIPPQTPGNYNVGGVLSATQLQPSAGSLSAPSLRHPTQSNTAVYFPSTGSVGVCCGGVNVLSVDRDNGYMQSTLGSSFNTLVSRGGSGTVTVNGVFSSGLYINDTAATITYQLPSIAGTGPGQRFTFVQASTGACILKAAAGQKIQNGGTLTATGGQIQSQSQGCAMTLWSAPGTAAWYVDAAPQGMWL